MYSVEDICNYFKDHVSLGTAVETYPYICVISIFDGNVDDNVDILVYDEKYGEVFNLLFDGNPVFSEDINYEYDIWLQDHGEDSIESFITFLIDRTVSSTKFMIEDYYMSICNSANDFIKEELTRNAE